MGSTGIAEEMNSFLWVKVGEAKERELLLKYGIPSSYEKSVLKYTENQHVDFKGWKEITFSSDASGIIKKITGERTVVQEDTSKSTNLDNDLIRSAQNSLEMLGYEVGPVDGVWGPKTRKAMLDALEKTGALDKAVLEELTDEQLLSLFRTGECSVENYNEAKPRKKTYYSQNSHVKYGSLSFNVFGSKLKRQYRDFEISPKNLEVELSIYNHGMKPESLYSFSFGLFDGRGAVYEPTHIENSSGLYSRLNPSSGAYPKFIFENFPNRIKEIYFAIVTNQGDRVAVFRLKPKTD